MTMTDPRVPRQVESGASSSMTFSATSSLFRITSLSHHLVYRTWTDEAQQAGQPEAPLTQDIVMAGTGDAGKGPPKQKVTDIVSTLRPAKVWPSHS